MGQVEWYRRTTWTSADAIDFAARLERSRSAYHKAQYLRIQAGHLHTVGSPELTLVALGLLDQLLREWPDESQLSLAHMQRAECLVDLGQPIEALAAYRDALEARRKAPNWRNDAHLAFGELVVALGRRDLYDEVLGVLNEVGDPGPFPSQQYSAAATRALIADALHDHSAAAHWAALAITSANRTESPFRRHRTLGVVTSVEPQVYARLQVLAGDDRDREQPE
jgi:tetratricopeptide (TPR) repeat protein